MCDKTEPSCGKCIKKGIACSGVNRIRFTEGVARRGKLKDCKIPDISNDGASHLPSKTSFPTIRWNDERKRGTKRKKEDMERDTTRTRAKESAHDSNQSNSSPTTSKMTGQLYTPSDIVGSQAQLLHGPSATSELDASTSELDAISGLEDDVEEINRVEDAMLQCFLTRQNLQRWLPPLTAEARMLFSYFSAAIAPVMVVFDTVSNGYRELILPMAFEDEVLRRAVGVVAAQHLSRERPEMRDAAEAGRAAVISRLRNDALSATEDQIFSKFTWATLVVLLVGETVTGSEDYSFLVQMLLCLSANSRAENGNTAVSRFLQTQTNM